MSIIENLERVKERIARAAERAGCSDAGRDGAGRNGAERNGASITIVAVTKTHGPEVVTEAIRAGIADVGENRVQEFLAKADAVRLPCRWHLVGHLQSNKIPKVVGRFALIQSIDSLHLAEALGGASVKRGLVTDILLEVNTSGEATKYGLEPAAVVEACGRIAMVPGLKIHGLMTVGPLVDDPATISAAFARLRGIRDEIASARIGNVTMEHLSMGMSDDFEIAVAEGSTMVRLGRVLFGERRAA